MTMVPSSERRPGGENGDTGDHGTDPVRDTGRARASDAPGWGEVAAAHPWLLPVLGLLAAVAGGWAFAAIAEQVYQGGVVLRLDSHLLEIIASYRTPTVIAVFGVVTYLGEGIITVCVAAVAALVLGRLLHAWVPALLLGLTAGGTSLSVFVIKLIIARPRPIPAPNAATEDSFAFPSGHSAHSAAVYLMVAILFLRVLHNRIGKVAVLATALLLIAVTGFSRLVLGVHSPSDVVAGWILGACFTLVLLSLWGLSTYLPLMRTLLVRHAPRNGSAGSA